MEIQKGVGVPLNAILELKLLRQARVLAGQGGLQRMVTAVNVLEEPDVRQWVADEQLLITTGYPYREDPASMGGLITQLNQAGAAGLGIKTKRYIDEVPQEILDMAESMDFPVIEIPKSVSFSDITTGALALVMNRQTQVLEEIHALHQSFTSAMLNGGNLNQIAGILHQRFENSVAIGSELFSSFAINTAPEKYKDVYNILQEEKRKRLESRSSDVPTSFRSEGDVLDETTCSRISVPIYSDGILYGHIYVWEDARTINNLELSAIESVTSLIALDITKKLSMLEMENDHKSGFLDDLLSGDSRRQQKALGNARAYDFDPKAAHRVAVVRPRGGKANFRSYGKTWFRLNANLVGILQEQVVNTSFKILYMNNDSSVVMLCEMPDVEDGEKEIRDFMVQLSRQLGLEYLEGQVSIGVGRRYEAYPDLHKSYAEARRAVNCAHMRENNVAFFEDLGGSRMLAYDNTRQEGKIFCQEILGPLLDYDEENDGELVKTLSAYFACNGNLTHLAERLGVHYNTAGYRMQQVRKLTGRKLEDDENSLDFRMALLLNRLWNYG